MATWAAQAQAGGDERLAFDKLHDKIRGRSGFFDAHVVKRDDRRMRQLTDNARLAQETVAGLATREFGGEKLYGNRAVDERVITADDTAMSARADGFKDLVAADLHGWCAPGVRRERRRLHLGWKDRRKASGRE